MSKIALSAVIALSAIVPAIAQETAKPAKQEPALRFTIKTQSTLTSSRRMLRDGEEMGGRFRGGAGGGDAPTVTKSEVVFDEGSSDGTTWRRYEKVEATITREGPDGEKNDATVEGALKGKKIVFVEGAALEGEKDGEPVEETLGRDLPTATKFADLVPAGSLAVDTKLQLDDSFHAALQSMIHPVRAARTEGDRGGFDRRGRGADDGAQEGERPRGGQDGERGRRGRGGEDGGQEGERPRGGQDGERGRRGRGGEEGGGRRGRGGEEGQRGRFGRTRAPRAANDASLNLIRTGKLDWSGEAVVASHEERDGKTFAVVKFTANAKGEGTMEELGLTSGFSRMMGRGGRGGSMGDVETEATADLQLTGTMLVDVQSRRPHSLEIDGRIKQVTDMFMVRRESEIEIHSDTRGKFVIEVACEECGDKAPVDDAKK